MDLHDYITATRQNIGSLCEPDLYRSMYVPKIKQVLGEANIHLDIVITYSFNRRCEVVRWRDRKHLIYDRNLGQTLNMMNRLILEIKDDKFAMRYMHKLAAEYMSSLDILLPEALACASFYNAKRGSKSRLPMPTPLRLYFTAVQEGYVMLHEAFHELYGNQAHLYAKFPVFIDDFCDQFHWEILNSNEPEEREKLLKRMLDQPKPARIGLSDEQIISYHKGDISNRYPDELALKALESSVTLKEELFCDLWATIWSALIHKDNLIDALRAVYYAHYHLRVLRHIEVHVEEYCRFIETGGAMPERDLFIPEEYIRSRFLLELCAHIGAAFAKIKEIAIDTVTVFDIAIAISIVQLEMAGGKEGPVTDEFNRVRDLLIKDQADHFAMLYDTALYFVRGGLAGRVVQQLLEENVVRKTGESLDKLRESFSVPDNAAQSREILNYMLTGVRVS